VIARLSLDEFKKINNVITPQLSPAGEQLLQTLAELLQDNLITRVDFETRKKEIYVQYVH